MTVLLPFECTPARAIVVVAAMVGAVSCAPGPRSEASADLVEVACYQPLGEFCKDAPCPSYAESAANLATLPGGAEGLGILQSSTGSCGAYRYTFRAHGFGARTLYFDATGALVAARVDRDYLNGRAECPAWTHFGPPVDCPSMPSWPSLLSADDQK